MVLDNSKRMNFIEIFKEFKDSIEEFKLEHKKYSILLDKISMNEFMLNKMYKNTLSFLDRNMFLDDYLDSFLENINKDLSDDYFDIYKDMKKIFKPLNFLLLKEVIVIHCKNMQETKQLYTLLDVLGYHWNGGDKLLEPSETIDLEKYNYCYIHNKKCESVKSDFTVGVAKRFIESYHSSSIVLFEFDKLQLDKLTLL